MDVQDKVAYITGGTKGIGLGIAKALIDAGMRVAISGRSEDSVNKGIESLGHPNQILGVVSNVSNPQEEVEAVEQITKKWGRLDVVIANAGVGHFAPIEELSVANWNEMIDTNLNGPFYTLKAALESLKETEGYYITIASLAGTNFFARGAGYNASKFGLVGFTQAAMLDLRPFNIKATTIMPGSVSSHFNNNEPSDKDAWKIQPEDVGQMVLDLLSMPARTLPSKIEVRPSRPDLKNS